ncbi:MAG: carboxypeptidase-like regulatory domain-containing protein, partial [Gemmatimonadetes bacterium]|nr:carboxypeptidase-like regulatory domain-containing protein [Gemmatimonadota bacterium]
MKSFACAFFLLFLIPAISPAQTGTIEGRVTDSEGSPVAGAAIDVEGTDLGALSDGLGEYEIRGVPAGTHTLRVRIIGYAASTATLTIDPDAVIRRDFSLGTEAIALAAVIVGSRARHTAEDELAVPVDVFTSDEIRRQGTVETSAILEELSPSVNFPRQSVTDATDIVRPFTLRGLS